MMWSFWQKLTAFRYNVWHLPSNSGLGLIAEIRKPVSSSKLAIIVLARAIRLVEQ